MLKVVDTGIGNLTAELVQQGMWDDCLMIITSDNGGIGPGNNYPFRGHKATPWEGGTRVMGFVTGGFLPTALRGKVFPRVIGVQDWSVSFVSDVRSALSIIEHSCRYPTLCSFAGVDATDNVTFLGSVRPIDGVDVWPAMLAMANQTETELMAPTTYLHEYLPTTTTSLIWQERWKLITSAGPTSWCMSFPIAACPKVKPLRSQLSMQCRHNEQYSH